MDEIRIYTLNEVSLLLKVTQRTLYNYVKSGALKAVKMGRHWRVTHEALKEFTLNGTTQQEVTK